MAYEAFAYWYDRFNGDADYDALLNAVLALLRRHGVTDGIVADLGCGTGELTLRLAKAGYDMLAIDASADMLAVLQEKLGGVGERVLLLQQDLADLDLYGTIRGAVSTFDTFNHLTPEQLQAALSRVFLFLEPGGLLLFDVNTPYKHEHILANHTFTMEVGGRCLTWKNEPVKNPPATRISLRLAEADGTAIFSETFFEYYYPLSTWKELVANAGFCVLSVQDGETFGEWTAASNRYLFAVQKPFETMA